MAEYQHKKKLMLTASGLHKTTFFFFLIYTEQDTTITQ